MVERYSNLIGGRWRSADAFIENRSPSDTSDVIGLYAQASRNDLDDAVSHARAAMRGWQSISLEQRQAFLNKVGTELMERADELGELLAREEGKTKTEGRGEVFRAGQFFAYYAAETLRQIGENADSVRAGVEIDMRREPMGLVGVVSPWNFPVATASWKIAPALAYGNTVIWKPANETPASAWALADIISRAGIPDGVFQLVMGRGSVVGTALASHRDVDAITFTGSYEVGCQVAVAAAANLTKFQLELGSKNALLVMDDANIDLAVTAAVVGGYSGTGQKCTASSRLLIHEKVHDQFVEKLTVALASLRVGHALESTSQMGPVVSLQQLESNISWLEKACHAGARLATGGERLRLKLDGHYMSPALLVDTDNSMEFNREEMFGPIAAVQKIRNYEHGLSVVNDTRYGLVSGIFTSSLARATHFRRNAQTGCVMVNLPTAGTDYHVPFGGRKDSSSGPREQGSLAAEFYTQVKTAYVMAGEPE